ncbi:alpha/beta fold hydrolase [Streptomyces sp. NPDC057540]|uniref:alpha/beta fold hydrolase n=1 Tax=Streptomyces sp. NPDC057540 TaxID=3346160 RepID=UPI0036744077
MGSPHTDGHEVNDPARAEARVLDGGRASPVLPRLRRSGSSAARPAHGHFGEGRTFAHLARELRNSWRIIAPDQRGHGLSDRSPDFSRAGYVEDAAAVLHHLGFHRAAVLGHSLGGVNAYQLAARFPRLVDALIVEDIGAEVDDDSSSSLAWPHRAPSRAELLEGLGTSARYLIDAVREFPDGWGLAFDPKEMNASQQELNGDHWNDWISSDCPALLVRGSRSTVLSGPGPWRPASPLTATACATRRSAACCRRTPSRLPASRGTTRIPLAGGPGGRRPHTPWSMSAGPRPLTPGDRSIPGLGSQHRAPVGERRTLAGHHPRQPPPAQQA